MIGRLAPTPSGELHLGNVVSFGAAWLSVRAQNGRLLLRMEDVDTTRSRESLVEGLRRDLRWLGLDWDEEVPRQSTRDYASILAQLPRTYLCTCRRAEVQGPYPGTCRMLGRTSGAVRWALPTGDVTFFDRKVGLLSVDPNTFGDPVLKRADGCFAYNLAVVADDLRDGVTEVVRGADLLEFTSVQISLWRALGATPPTFLHAPLILGPDGKKLSKSHGSLSVRSLREHGWAPDQVWRKVLPWLGLSSTTLTNSIQEFNPEKGPSSPIQITDWNR